MTRSTLVASTRERNRVVEEGLADVYLDVDAGSVGMLDFAKGTEVAIDAAERVRPVLAAWLATEASGGSPPGYVRVPRTPKRGGPAPTGRFGLRGVLLLTARDLQMRASRFASAILGTSVVFTMLFLMTGLTEQFHREPRQLVDALGAEAWVLHEGASGAFTSSATLPASLAQRVTGATAVPVVTARQALDRRRDPDRHRHRRLHRRRARHTRPGVRPAAGGAAARWWSIDTRRHRHRLDRDHRRVGLHRGGADRAHHAAGRDAGRLHGDR